LYLFVNNVTCNYFCVINPVQSCIRQGPFVWIARIESRMSLEKKVSELYTRKYILEI